MAKSSQGRKKANKGEEGKTGSKEVRDFDPQNTSPGGGGSGPGISQRWSMPSNAQGLNSPDRSERSSE